ncbi:MAG: virulence protein SciE type [Gammaproteobacteria bacterium]|nr:virulence protein SciE type [Gammaproteobacteria bacterium]MBU1507133.1 virulence protein SciE type [Gammaproteobacteria bacterium]MBU2121343.1 virulence protein SciE type [Gammaproteobacteria bacterium]MBU2171106.1 virulence protein SciE type [Gammaproteobacteria bacterium]MBU2201582.1 virulence protein SciE type [Gammaproteobacteria bacterium]
MSTTFFDSKESLDVQLNHVKDAIRAEPSNASLRTFYFQLLAVVSDWNKALAQLQVCAQLDPKALPMAHAYREAMRCELLRSEVFEGRRTPFIVGEPPEWLSYMVDALKAQADTTQEGAFDLRTRALDMAPAISGTLNGEPFGWLSDSDSRLGPVFELYSNGCYYWVPFSAIRSIALEKPQDLRDVVWQPAELTLVNEGTLQGVVPARYPAHADDDDGLRLARRTEWSEIGGDHVAGRGQKVLITEQGDHALLDVRTVAFNA